MAPINQTVSGLPVFLTPSEALYWIDGKEFEDMPAIAALEIPLEMFNDQISLINNAPGGTYQRPIKQTELTNLSEGKLDLKGEFFLTGLENGTVPDAIRQHEKLLRPNELDSEGKVRIEKGFVLVENDGSKNLD